MFFTECAILADRHPDLARVFERIDSQFGAMGTAEVIRSDDFASLLHVEPNQMRAALGMLAKEGLLLQVEMIECTYCQMALLPSDYQEAVDEEEDYRCTSCDRPLTDDTIETITTYRAGEKWPKGVNRPSSFAGIDDSETLSSSATGIALDDQGWYSHVRLAVVYNVGKDALRKRLDRYREHHFDGWKATDDRRSTEPKYLYQLRAVRGIVEELRASSQRPAK